MHETTPSQPKHHHEGWSELHPLKLKTNKQASIMTFGMVMSHIQWASLIRTHRGSPKNISGVRFRNGGFHETDP